MVLNNRFFLETDTVIQKFNKYSLQEFGNNGEKIIAPDFDSGIVEGTIDIRGIAYEFARINSDEKKLLDFVSKYGLLGLHPANIFIRNDYIYYLKNFALTRNPSYESVAEYAIHIDHVRKLLKLYNAIVNGEEIEDEIIRIMEFTHSKAIDIAAFNEVVEEKMFMDGAIQHREIYHLNRMRDSNRNIVRYFLNKSNEPTNQSYQAAIAPIPYFSWIDSVPTMIPYSDLIPTTDEGYGVLAQSILMVHLQEMLKYSVYVDFNNVLSKLPLKSARELKLVDKKATPYLLSAIYYDVWQIVNNRDRIEFCISCGAPFKVIRKGRQYCPGGVCKQREWRKSK